MKRSNKKLHVETVQVSQKEQSDSTVDTSLIHFSHSGKIRLQKLKKSANLSQKSWKSENSLAALFEPVDKLHEGGIGEGNRPCDNTALLSVPPQSQHNFGRRRSVSLNNIPLALLCNTGSPSGSTYSIPALATCTKTAEPELDLQHAVVNLHASSLKSCKSIQMLSGEDFEAMASNLHEDILSTKEIAVELPTVPKRRSAFLKNCVVTDDYLIRQGKRLSGLPLDSIASGEENRSVFKRVGDKLKKVRSSNLLTSSCEDMKVQVQGCLNPPHFVLGQNKSESIQNLRNLQSGPTQQCVVLRCRKTSKSWDDLRLATHSCSDSY